MTDPTPGLLDEATETTTHTEPVDAEQVSWEVECRVAGGDYWGGFGSIRHEERARRELEYWRKALPEDEYRLVRIVERRQIVDPA